MKSGQNKSRLRFLPHAVLAMALPITLGGCAGIFEEDSFAVAVLGSAAYLGIMAASVYADVPVDYGERSY